MTQTNPHITISYYLKYIYFFVVSLFRLHFNLSNIHMRFLPLSSFIHPSIHPSTHPSIPSLWFPFEVGMLYGFILFLSLHPTANDVLMTGLLNDTVGGKSSLVA